MSAKPHPAHVGPPGSVFVVHDERARLEPHASTSHTEHGLTYLVRGRLRIEHGRSIRLEPGTLTLMPAGVPHRSLGGRDVEYWLVGFCCSCVGLDESQPLMQCYRRVRAGAFPVVEIPRSRRARIVRLYRDLQEECERNTAESPELRRSLLLLLLGEALRAMPTHARQSAEGSLVTDALEFVQRHCLEPISLKDVAAAVLRSPAHVAATVKASTGYTVGDWIANARVTEAVARLAHTDDSIDHIARDVGWKDKTHFIRQFRKIQGSTPAAWRREHRAAHEPK